MAFRTWPLDSGAPPAYVDLMTDVDLDVFVRLSKPLADGSRLSPAERTELLRIAQGFSCKDSAGAAGLSLDTIRARRKRIYHKLNVAGATETLSYLLALALRQLARGGEASTVAGQQRAAPAAEPAL